MQATPKTSLKANPSHWKLQDAKTQFSALVRQAQAAGPQHVSVHGKPSVVVVSAQEYLRLKSQKAKPSFTALMRGSPLAGLDLDTTRLEDPVRGVQLDD